MNGTSYLWIKALHVIAVIAWYAGLFYIFRLYVYHVQKRSEPAVTATLEVMERRLLRIIINPAMIATTVIILGRTRSTAPTMIAVLRSPRLKARDSAAALARASSKAWSR